MNDSQLDSRIGAAIATGARDVVVIADRLTTEQARIAERLIWLLGEGSVILTTSGYVSTDEATMFVPATRAARSIDLDLLALLRDGLIEGTGDYRDGGSGLQPVFIATAKALQ